MNSKKWLAFYAIVSLLLIGAAGYFCFHFFSQFNSAKSGWNKREAQITTLRKKPIYPNKENADKLKAVVDDYESSVDKLFASLDEFQRPLETDLVDSKFSIELTQLVDDFRRYAASKGVEIQDLESFGLGFEEFSNRTPEKELVAELEYGLNATEHLLRILVESGASKLEYIARDKIAGEQDGPKVDPTNSVIKYPIRLAFDASHDSLRTFINSLPNDKKYFYVIRILQVKNRNPEGPFKDNRSVNSDLSFESQEDGQIATPEQLLEWGLGTLSNGEIAGNAAEAGYTPSGEDARQIMGNELVNAFMVVDIIRFIDPTSAASANKKSATSKSKP